MSNCWGERSEVTHPTVCFVSEDEPPDCTNEIRIIHKHIPENIYPFIDTDGCEWKYATPLSAEYFCGVR